MPVAKVDNFKAKICVIFTWILANYFLLLDLLKFDFCKVLAI